MHTQRNMIMTDVNKCTYAFACTDAAARYDRHAGQLHATHAMVIFIRSREMKKSYGDSVSLAHAACLSTRANMQRK